MNRTLFLTAYLACLFVITGCGEDPGYDKFAPSPSGSIRYVNAVTDAPSLVVEFGTQSLGNTPFGQLSSINSVIPGLERNTEISYVKDNQLEVIATLSILVPEDQLKTLILTGTMANLTVIEVLEDLSVPAETDTTTTLRIANAAGALDDAVSLTIFDSTASETHCRTRNRARRHQRHAHRRKHLFTIDSSDERQWRHPMDLERFPSRDGRKAHYHLG